MLLKMAAIALTAALLAMLLRQQSPLIAITVAGCGGVLILLMAWEPLMGLLDMVRSLSQNSGLSPQHWALAWKVTALALGAELTCGLCEQTGEGVLAKWIRFGARVVILSLTAPLLLNMLEQITAWA